MKVAKEKLLLSLFAITAFLLLDIYNIYFSFWYVDKRLTFQWLPWWLLIDSGMIHCLFWRGNREISRPTLLFHGVSASNVLTKVYENLLSTENQSDNAWTWLVVMSYWGAVMVLFVSLCIVLLNCVSTYARLWAVTAEMNPMPNYFSLYFQNPPMLFDHIHQCPNFISPFFPIYIVDK